jgi:thioredoxin-like negative regulator of GroEL
MADASSNLDWSPGTDPVVPEDFNACPVRVLHYWAIWNLHDREMDRRLAALRHEYGDRICFRSCDIDRAVNKSSVRGIANIPALGCFVRGKWHESLIGLRPVEELRSVFDGWLAAADTPAIQTLQQTWAAGMFFKLQTWLGRGPSR